MAKMDEYERKISFQQFFFQFHGGFFLTNIVTINPPPNFLFGYLGSASNSFQSVMLAD